MSVSYEEVAVAAHRLLARGEKPTLKKVRMELHASPNDVQPHLKKWRDAQPAKGEAVAAISSGLMAALADELRTRVAEARADVEEQLAEAREDADQLQARSEELAQETLALQTRVAALSTDRDRLQGQLEQRQQELRECAERSEREQAAAEAARVELATERFRAEGRDQLAAQQAADNERLHYELEALQKAVRDAEQQAAIIATKLEAAREHHADVAAAMQTQILGAVQRYERAEAALEETRMDMSKAREEYAELRGKLARGSNRGQRTTAVG